MPANSADYQREYRQRSPEYVERTRALEKARTAAYRRLAVLYPGVFTKLYEAEKKERGL